jgi:hypothetical protein
MLISNKVKIKFKKMGFKYGQYLDINKIDENFKLYIN